MPGAPLVIGDVVVVGVGGGEFGARGYLTGYDAATGKLLWRAFSTGSDAEVLLDGPANTSGQAGMDLGLSSWTAQGWQRGGGATWGWLTYDPELELLYHGTGGAAPLNPLLRPGDNKWTSSVFARDPRTGRARWARQLSPNSSFAYDASNEYILADLNLNGRAVKALVHFDHNGFVYVIDRATGRIVSAEKFGPVNWARRVDLETGLPVVEPQWTVTAGQALKGVCPSIMGGKGPAPASYYAPTGQFFAPLNNVCMDYEPQPATFTAGRPFLGAIVKMQPGPGDVRGRFVAWDAARSTLGWEIREPFPLSGGALTTATGLVFYATLDGWFKAVDARNGSVLWRFRTPSGNIGSPISFAGPDGRQYVALVSGAGGWAGPAFARTVARNAPDLYGVTPMLNDLPGIVNPGGVLLVFGLP
jgi:PQQ-dependent dehydrogenase (methanol/ethanol family)